MNNLNKIIIEASRLKLKSTSEKYAQDIFKEFSEKITTFMHSKAADDISETLAFIKMSQNKMSKSEELQVVILDKGTDEFLGHGGIRKLNTNTPELGIWIKESAHGNNYGKEVISALKEWIDNNLQYKYIVYPVDKRNIPSRKIAESLGGVIESSYKKKSMSGNILDEVEYRIYPDKS